MTRRMINRISIIVPIVMSVLALLIVLIVVTTSWERNLADEGAAAHIFQLLIVAQLPFITAFLITADWKRLMHVVRPLALQVLSICLAVGSVAYFKL